ncbi:hypothetical protein RJ639_017350 [Escallonia herrerae]|uniref:Reverse transcriptase/retrotransposon-derived protein RNase H-like domain-containing protein n=1 Tax=Escallonia herrerae TaxID=1293975 RepID=A0AA88VC81_9ASTE|nr:hypothetical protein RJ639_017350 [Escallonia herrerae]
MARSAERCSPFFKAIKKAKNFVWTDNCQKSFEELKTHLSSLPLLSKPLPGEDLLIYLSVTEVAVSTILIRKEDGVQKPIYYVSKVLQDVETRYPKIDKIALALIISARRLRPYYQSHTIVVLTDQPLSKVLLSPKASGRLVNWSVELGEFDLQYKPCTAIKAQALADFIIECTLPKDPPQLVISEVTDPWNLYVDGSSAVGSSGAGIILINTLSKFSSAEETEVRRPIYLEFLKDRSISSHAEIEIIDQEPCWMDMIIKYLSTGELPSERHEARNLRVKATMYALVEVEIGVPTIQALHFNELNNEVGFRANLDLVEEARTHAHVRSVAIKQRVARYYNQRVRSKQFNEGDLVLRKLEVSDPKAATGKLTPNWEGPYRVIKVLKTGAYALSGESIPSTWNAENLCRYYQ